MGEAYGYKSGTYWSHILSGVFCRDYIVLFWGSGELVLWDESMQFVVN